MKHPPGSSRLVDGAVQTFKGCLTENVAVQTLLLGQGNDAWQSFSRLLEENDALLNVLMGLGVGQAWVATGGGAGVGGDWWRDRHGR